MRKTLLCLLAAGIAPAGWAAPLTLTFDAAGITASGATAAGEVAWFGVARVPRSHLQEVSTVLRLETADAAGTAALSLDAPAPARSLWLAVDLATGAVDAGTPASLRLVSSPLTTHNLSRSASGAANGLLLPQRQAEILWVRPASGAWAGRVTDGAGDDLDGTVNRGVALALRTLEPLGTVPAPDTLQAGDVLVVIDPNQLTYRLATVTPALLAGEGR